jgi:tetratricopeptide (TPR) repeat protein
MRRWPPGLQPTSLFACRHGVEFCYLAPENRLFRVMAQLGPGPPRRLEVHEEPGSEPFVTARLGKAVALRLQRSPGARGWLSRAAVFVEEVSRMRAFGGDGGDPIIDRLLEQVLALSTHESDRDALGLDRDLDALERALADARSKLGDDVLAELGIVAWLTAGSYERALELWDRHSAVIEARDDLRDLACSALVRGYLGYVGEAQARAARLVARTCDAVEARYLAALLAYLHQPALAARQLHLAASDPGDGRAFEAHHRLARVAAEGRVYELAREAAEAMCEHAEGPAQRVQAASMLREAGEFGSAEAVLEQILAVQPDERDATRMLATLRLWRGDHRGAAGLARELLERDPDDLLALRSLGIAAHLDGRSRASLELLDRVLELDERDDEARLWRPEILDDLGRCVQARKEVSKVALGDHPAWQLVVARIELGFEHENHRFIADDLIRQLLGDEAVARGHASRQLAIDTITRALARFGGNRSARLTTLTSDGSLRWLDELVSPRRRAELCQLEATRREVDEVLTDFEALAKAHPEVPFFVTYPAELLLWRGDYERAFARFEQIWQATRTRWGYVGSGAAAMLLGRHEQALALWEEGKAYYRYLDAEATYCYRGELFRRRGELEPARADLELALRARPTRLGAWVNLALLEHAAGREQALRAAVARVEALCPPYAWAARREAGLAQPRAALEADALATWMSTLLALMRGNRSSVMYTIVERDTDLRVLSADPPQVSREYGRRCLGLFMDELLRELAGRRGL